MNKDLIPLVDLLHDTKGLEEEQKYIVFYKPNKRSINITSNEDGINAAEKRFFGIPNQTFETEEFMYYPILDENNIPYLISTGITKKQLFLFGNNLNSLIEVIKKVCALYNSKELNAKGILITEELIKILPSHMQKTETLADIYYIDKTMIQDITYSSSLLPLSSYNIYNFPGCEVQIHDNLLFTCNNGRIQSHRITGDKNANCIINASIRPVIALPKDIKVDTEKISGKRLTLHR